VNQTPALLGGKENQNSVQCPMCGLRIGEAEAGKTCNGCPMAGHCKKVKCPNCGYEIVRAPDIGGWWRRVVARLRHGGSGEAEREPEG
jgi:DNA-directed RNA polymerase subunit RPC12/RpoP